MKFDVIHR